MADSSCNWAGQIQACWWIPARPTQGEQPLICNVLSAVINSLGSTQGLWFFGIVDRQFGLDILPKGLNSTRNFHTTLPKQRFFLHKCWWFIILRNMPKLWLQSVDTSAHLHTLWALPFLFLCHKSHMSACEIVQVNSAIQSMGPALQHS